MLKKLGNIEEKIIFNITRLVSLFIITGIFILLILGLIGFFNMKSTTYVNYSTIKNQLTAEDTPINNQSPKGVDPNSLEGIAPQVEIPQKIRNVFKDQNREVLISWLKDLSPEKQRDFISNLNNIITEAENDEDVLVTDAINNYKNLKFNKFSQEANNPYSEYEEIAKKIGMVLFVIISIFLIGLFALVLVLLAIERNTRQNNKVSEKK